MTWKGLRTEGIIIMDESVYREFTKEDFKSTTLADMFIETAKEVKHESCN